MTEQPSATLPYLAAQVREALSTDPRTGELGIEVRVSGSELVLTGGVASDDRRRVVGEVAEEAAAGCHVRNDVTAVELSPPTRSEAL